MDADAALRRTVTEIIRRSTKSRAQIAEELGKRMHQRVTEHILNDFTSERKKAARFPAAFIEAFCEITGDDKLQRLVMGERLRKLVEFAERELAASKEERERQRLRDELCQFGGRDA